MPQGKVVGAGEVGGRSTLLEAKGEGDEGYEPLEGGLGIEATFGCK